MTEAMTEPSLSRAGPVAFAVARPARRPDRLDNVVSISAFRERCRSPRSDDDGLYEPVYLEQAFQGLAAIRVWRADVSRDLFGCFIVEVLTGSKGGRVRLTVRSFASVKEAGLEVGRLCHEAMAKGFRPLH